MQAGKIDPSTDLGLQTRQFANITRGQPDPTRTYWVALPGYVSGSTNYYLYTQQPLERHSRFAAPDVAAAVAKKIGDTASVCTRLLAGPSVVIALKALWPKPAPNPG